MNNNEAITQDLMAAIQKLRLVRERIERDDYMTQRAQEIVDRLSRIIGDVLWIQNDYIIYHEQRKG